MYKKQHIADNIRELVRLGYAKNISTLAVSADLTKATLTTFMKEPELRNLSMDSLIAIAKVMKIPPWMLLVPNFPFESIKGKPLKGISSLSYSALHAIEGEPNDVRLLMLEGIAGSLSKINDVASQQIKDAQAEYLIRRRTEERTSNQTGNEMNLSIEIDGETYQASVIQSRHSWTIHYQELCHKLEFSPSDSIPVREACAKDALWKHILDLNGIKRDAVTWKPR